MGKSPAKWIKAVLLGKKASKSNLTKNVTTERTLPTNTGPTESDLLLEATNEGVEIIQPEKGTLVNLPSDESSSLPVIQSPNSHGSSSVNEEQASIKVQAAFRGYLARRAFRALKGIIRLQALIRGHLVRRQAIATLNCMQAIIKLQALVRGRKVRILYPNLQVKLTQNQVQPTFTQKLVTYTFAKKLIESLPNAMPLSLQYELTEPNSARNWLERWSIICFWEIIPQPKKIIDKKNKNKLPIESGKSKRTIKKVPNVSNNDNNGFRNSKKITESTQEHPQNELERVKRSLRKVSASEKPETDGLGPVSGPKSPPIEIALEKVSLSETETPAKVIEAAPVKVIEDGPVKEEEVVEVIEENGGPTEKVVNRRRRSLPTKQEYTENVSQNTRTVPSYMLATESAKAKLRAQLAANNNNNNNNNNEEMNDLSENSFIRRHSLPSLSNNSKLSSVSPRVVKPLQANGKGGNKVNKSLDKGQVPPGWRR